MNFAIFHSVNSLFMHTSENNSPKKNRCNEFALLTKDDKIDIILRMDNHFKWLVTLFVGFLSIAVTLIKLLD